MNSKVLVFAFFIQLFGLSLSPFSHAHAGLFGPSNYEDCVLDYQKDAKVDQAVIAIAQMCSMKFAKGGDSRYPDCVLDKIEHAKTEQAVIAIAQMCSRKHQR